MNGYVLTGMLSFALLISGCGLQTDAKNTAKETNPPAESNVGSKVEKDTDQLMPEENAAMRMTIENTPVRITWEDNESVTALRELARK